MQFDSIRWRLTLSYALIALLAAFSLGLVLRSILRNYYDRQEARYLQTRAMEIGSIASQLLEADLPPRMIEELSKSWSFMLQARVQILGADGEQLADSGVPEAQQVFFIASEQPFEIPLGQSVVEPAGEVWAGALPASPGQFFQIQVLRSETTNGIDTQEDVIMFSPGSVGVALPADASMYGLLDPSASASTRRSSQVVEQQVTDRAGNMLGKVILSDGPAYGDEILNNVMNGWVIAGVAAVLLAALAGWLVSTRIATPLTELTRITSRMSQGDLSARAAVQSKDEIGTLGRSFNEMAARVEETVGTLRSFVADAAHELHTPLTALQANIELARDEKNPAERSRYLTRAHEQGRRLEALVQSLLDLSRIEAAESKLSFTPLSFTQLVREAGEQFASRAEQADRSFTMNVPEDVLHVLGNETQLRQVAVNLLENALKFTPTGGWISLNVERSSGQLVLTVSDSGIGIPSEDLPHLFERFHRGRNAAEYPGNGLGLAIVKAIVNAHGGAVSVQSTSPQGSTISVSLPVL
ncbi:MAG TPA: HAMP domain-containing sensor histidine kinase [Anaerolineales bacterium]|nr:HAMP domain-containing sensor histidine kinase [Anaerolineales bacterium]